MSQMLEQGSWCSEEGARKSWMEIFQWYNLGLKQFDSLSFCLPICKMERIVAMIIVTLSKNEE